MIEKIYILILILFLVYLSIYKNFNYIFYLVGIGLIFLLGFLGLNRVITIFTFVIYLTLSEILDNNSNVILYFILVLTCIITYKHINKLMHHHGLRVFKITFFILIGLLITIGYLYLVDLFGYKIDLKQDETVNKVPLDEIEDNMNDLHECGLYKDKKFMRYV